MERPQNHGNAIFTELSMYHLQLKIYHLQTSNYARHLAASNLYDALTKQIDRFMELYKARYGPIVFTPTANADQIALTNVADAIAIDSLLKPYIDFLEHKLVAKLRAPHDADLLNLRDEMLADANQALYLFQLN